MNIQTVRDNLKNTISGKERLYQSYCSDKDYASMAEVYVINAKLEFLKINIDELKRILADVESCVAKDIEQSWRDNPDRSGGEYVSAVDRPTGWHDKAVGDFAEVLETVYADGKLIKEIDFATVRANSNK